MVAERREALAARRDDGRLDEGEQGREHRVRLAVEHELEPVVGRHHLLRVRGILRAHATEEALLVRLRELQDVERLA